MVRPGSVQGGARVVLTPLGPAAKRAKSKRDLETALAPITVASPPELSRSLTRALAALETPYLQQRLAAIFADPDPAVLARAEKLIALAEPHAERPLLLALSATFGREDLTSFVRRLNEMGPSESRRKTSVIDRHWDRNDNRRDPIALSDRRGVIHPRGGNDRATDNDGLFQRFTATCGPSVIQMMFAELNPAYALRLHDAGLFDEGASDLTARFQRELLEAHGGIAIGNEALTMRSRFRNALGRLDIGDDDKSALRNYVEQKGKLTSRAAKTLELMRRTYDGFPSPRELADLRRRKIAPRDEGLGFEDFAAALAKVITPLTGIEYRQTTPPGGFARGQAWRHLDAVARTLRAGIMIPFGIEEPSHWMLATDVEGKKPNRRFLISDPLGGKTAWVTERDMISGVFAREQFNLCVARERGYIDSFYLPAIIGNVPGR